MSKYAQFFALYKQINVSAKYSDRSEFIADVTGNKASSLQDLSDHDYRELLQYMRREVNADKKRLNNDADTRLRRKVIALFANQNYLTPEGKSDMKRINEWCVKYGHLHQKLNSYSGPDLVKLVSQAEAAYKSFIAAI